jgi:hypothetical protein
MITRRRQALKHNARGLCALGLRPSVRAAPRIIRAMFKCLPRKACALRAGRCAASLIVIVPTSNATPPAALTPTRDLWVPTTHRLFAVGPVRVAPCSPRQGPAVNGRRRPPLTRLRAVQGGPGQQLSQ